MAVQEGYRDYNPTPGPQQPDKYPAPVGNNYQQYGEQQGYVYDPYSDTYYPDPQVSEDYYSETGLVKQDKKPGMGEYIGPIAMGAGAIAAGQILGNPEKWGPTAEAVKDVFSMGADKPVSAIPSAAPSAATAAPAPFSMGGPSAVAGTDLATNVPFSFSPTGAETGAVGAEAVSGSVPPAPNVVSATTMAPGAGNTFGVMGGLGPVLGVGGQAYYHYDQLKTAYDEMSSGRTSGQGAVRAAMMSNPLTSWAAPFVDKLGISSGKHADQYQRDAMRDYLREMQFLDENYNVTNPDGSTFNMGLDGGARLEGGHLEGKRHYYDVNLEDPSAVSMIPIADTLAGIVTGGNKKLTSDMTGYLVNAATSSGDPRANMVSYFERMGLDHATAYGQIHMMSQPQKDEDGNEKPPLLDKETADAYKNSLDQFFGVGAYANGAKPAAGVGPAPAPGIPAAKPPTVAPPPKPQMQTSTPAPAGRPQAPALGSGGMKPLPAPAKPGTTMSNVAPGIKPPPPQPQPQKPMNTSAKPVRGNMFQKK